MMSQSSVDLWVGNAQETENSTVNSTSQNARDQPNGLQQPVNNGQDPYVQAPYDPHTEEYEAQYDGNGQQEMYDDGYTEESIPDILLLNYYCARAFPPQDDSDQAKADSDLSWEPVRDWMRTHSAEEVRGGAEQRDDAGKTALHFACQTSPPHDVIGVFTSVAGDIVQWPDNFGWLPIHYACAYGADTKVIKALADCFPDSKTTVDRKGRTPLHFALGTSNAHSSSVVVILCSTGAASYADDNGMLPLHYACAYGALEDCLYVLTDAFPGAIAAADYKGRTPLHFALSNAGRPAAPSAVRLLLSLDKTLANSKGGPLPMKVLGEFAGSLPKDAKKQRESCVTCLQHLLGADPTPTADFFTALQSLPIFLQEVAVVMKVVQELLNFKIAQRFPTFILMLDFYAQMMVVTCYSITTKESIDERFFDSPENLTVSEKLLYALYAGATYFLVRELIQVLSLLSLGAFRIWWREPSNWLNVLYVGVLYFWTVHMTLGTLDNDFFRVGSAVSIIFIWVKFLSFLRNMLIDFAVFTGGVFHVMRRLAAFLVCLIIILVAFSRMFFTLFRQSDYCINDPSSQRTEEKFIADLQCESNDIRPWCDGWDAFLAIYTMLLGEVDETKFEDDRVAMFLFVLFMFLVVILLANVLIAIVTDSYKVIQDQRSAIVFWTNRLNFIAQMDAIANGPWKGFIRTAIGMREKSVNSEGAGLTNTFGKDTWKRLMDMFDEDVQEQGNYLENLFYLVLRILTLLFVIPAWVVLGLVSMGWFWPPQMREFVFTSAVSKHNSESEKEEELRRTQLVKMKAEIKVMRDELKQELALDRTQIVQTKSLVAERKIEIQNEMKHIKRIVTMLFEQGNM